MRRCLCVDKDHRDLVSYIQTKRNLDVLTSMTLFYLLGFTERPFFDRAFDDRSGPRNPRGNNMENRREESANRQTWNPNAKDEDRMSVNSSEPNDAKEKKASRWGNSSPKSIISDEENWDDEGERKNDGKNDGKSTILPLPQTEPIDDSDVDFDDGATATATASAIEKPAENECDDAGVEDNEPQQSVPLQPATDEQNSPKSFDMFADNESTTARPQETTFNNCDDESVGNTDNLNESTECTTPLYDEPEEKKGNIEKDEQNEVGVSFTETKDEKKWEPELPGIPGIDD